MKTQVFLLWQEQEIEIDSLKELDEWLDKLTLVAQRSFPFTVGVYFHDHNAILFVLGLEVSHLEHFSNNESPVGIGCYYKWPQYEEFTFYHRGEISEMGNENFVPVDLAREAVREFYLTRKRPTIIKWGFGGTILE